MPRVFVSIGSNIDKEKHVSAAIHELRARYTPLMLSSLYESSAVGFDGEDFYNLVAGFDTQESLEQVIAMLFAIEQRYGRVRGTSAFMPRTLDLDLLLYGNTIAHTNTLQVPRPEISQYAFVLEPLAEIAPNTRHPETQLTFTEMLEQLNTGDQKIRRVTKNQAEHH